MFLDEKIIPPEETIKALRKEVDYLQKSVLDLIEKLSKARISNSSLQEKLVGKYVEPNKQSENGLYLCPANGCATTVEGKYDICFTHLQEYITELELSTKIKEWSVQSAK